MRLTDVALNAALAGALGFLVLAPAAAQDSQKAPPTQDQAVTEVEEITVTGGLAPVPLVGQGAPQLSAEQLRVIARQARMDNTYFASQSAAIDDCYMETYGVRAPDVRVQGYEDAHEAAMRLSAFSQAAAYAAQDALDARRNFVLGKATQAQVDAAELERQKTVLRVLRAQNEIAEGKAKALDAQELSREKMPLVAWRGIIEQRAAERAESDYAWTPVPKQFQDLKIEEVKAITRDHPQMGQVIHVTGQIRNTRAKRIDVPPLSVSAIDEDGFALKSETATARGRIAPGEAIPFAYDLTPIPARAKTVAVTFGDPKRPAWLLPATVDAACIPPGPMELDPTKQGVNTRRGINARSFIRGTGE